MEEGMILFPPLKPARKRRFARVIFPPQNFLAIEHSILSPYPFPLLFPLLVPQC